MIVRAYVNIDPNVAFSKLLTKFCEHNDTQYNDIQHNDTQHYDIRCNNK